MAWGYIRVMPITLEQYDQADKEIGSDPEGLILHASAQTSGGVRIIDVWESKEANERFEREKLFPALKGMGLAVASDPPPREEFDVHNLRGRAVGG